MEAMSTWSARYVRLGEGAERTGDVARLLQRIDRDARLNDDGKSRFAVWLVPSPTFQPTDLEKLSKEFGEAIAVAVQTVADLVIYDHFVAGARVRGLTYAGEAGWIRVAGEPEPWENKALFSAEKLAELSEELEEDLDGDLLAREKTELERLWETGKLVEGSARPPADPAGFTRAIEKHFALPVRPTSAHGSGTIPRV
jgi:hypothetical protein